MALAHAIDQFKPKTRGGMVMATGVSNKWVKTKTKNKTRRGKGRGGKYVGFFG